jgi:hypothetical protein
VGSRRHPPHARPSRPGSTRAKTGPIALHPSALAYYEQQVTDLQAAVSKGIASGGTELASALRRLVETATVRRPRGGLEVEIAGYLAELMEKRSFPGRSKSGGTMVAEVRYIALPTTENAFFCYRLRAA